MAALFCYVDLLAIPAVPWALAASAVGATAYRRTSSVEVLSDHAQIHAFFTNRGVPVALGIVVAAPWLVATQPRDAQVEGADGTPRRWGTV